MKYLKLFLTESARNTYLSGEVIKPNVSVVKGKTNVVFVPKPIVFYINDVEYPVRHGMMWKEWIASDLNPGNIFLGSGEFGQVVYVENNNNYVQGVQLQEDDEDIEIIVGNHYTTAIRNWPWSLRNPEETI